jgi:adenosine deaminase
MVKNIPKVDLHRHLEGSVRLSTLIELGRRDDVPIPPLGEAQLRARVQVSDDLSGFHGFLKKFRFLRRFYQSPEIIQRITAEAVEDAATDGVRYLELRFSPQALAAERGFDLSEVTDWVIAAGTKAAARYDIGLGLIVTIVRNESVAAAEKTAQVAVDRRDDGIVGLDLAGDEHNFPPEPFAAIFRQAKQDNLFVTVHAGEWSGAEAVQNSIVLLGADRIGHGVRALECPRVAALLKERTIPLEICLTSNVQTGVVPSIAAHPLMQLMDGGIYATINTDDPGVCATRLSDEYLLAMNILGMEKQQIHRLVLDAANAAFLSPRRRQALVTRLDNELNLCHLQVVVERDSAHRAVSTLERLYTGARVCRQFIINFGGVS